MIQGMFRSNYVIMGIPVATALLGADQLGTVSILIAIIVPIFNMVSIIVLEVFRGQKPKPLHILGQIAKNPLVIASVLGVLALVAKHPPAVRSGKDGAERERHRIAPAAVSARRVFPVLRSDGAMRRELTAVVGRQSSSCSPGLFLGLGALLGFRDAAFVSLHGCVRLADRRQLLHHGAADGRRRRACRRHRRRDLGREHADDVFVGLSVQIPRACSRAFGSFTNRAKPAYNILLRNSSIMI